MTNKQLQARLNELKTILKPARGESLADAARRLTREHSHRPEGADSDPAPANTSPSSAIIRTAILMIPPDNPPPPMAPDMGDLTPAFARWALQTNPLDACRERYAGREQYLPDDVQSALQARA